ncbi:MAG: ABC transporter substrate-binding protein [Anaerolineae bacterium]
MKLRAFTLIVALGLLAAPLVAEGQQAGDSPEVGFLFPGLTTFLSGGGLMVGKPPAFSQGLRELGYVDGQNISIRFLSAEAQFDRFPDFAAQLVEDNVRVIVAMGDQAIHAAKQATKTIPIVMAPGGDPVRSGFVEDPAKPAGNATGLAALSPELSAKRLEVLKEAVPMVSRVAILWNPTNPASALGVKDIRVAARAFGVTLHSVEVRRASEFDSTFKALTSARADALIVLGDPFTVPYRAWIVALAAKAQLPAIYEERNFAEDGGLMSYGPSYSDIWRRAAYFVDKILKGAKPADLPVEQPREFELVINLKTAKALGLTIPPSVLLRADKVIR